MEERIEDQTAEDDGLERELKIEHKISDIISTAYLQSLNRNCLDS